MLEDQKWNVLHMLDYVVPAHVREKHAEHFFDWRLAVTRACRNKPLLTYFQTDLACASLLDVKNRQQWLYSAFARLARAKIESFSVIGWASGLDVQFVTDTPGYPIWLLGFNIVALDSDSETRGLIKSDLVRNVMLMGATDDTLWEVLPFNDDDAGISEMYDLMTRAYYEVPMLFEILVGNDGPISLVSPDRVKQLRTLH